jgi:hypothetical protein
VVAFVIPTIITIAMVAGLLWYMRRRPVGAPVSWGEAMVASAYVFTLMFLAYGIVPNQWLLWADNELEWRADRILIDTYPIKVTYLVLRDIIVVGIYVVMLVGNVAIWAMWQNRGKKKEAAPALETSTFGRPLVKRG